MIIIAKYGCQLEGRIYERGSEVEYDGPITSRIAHNFTDADGKPLKVEDKGERNEGTETQGGTKSVQPPTPADPEKEKAAKAKELVEKLAKTMNREALTAKLDEMGVTYKATHKNTDLAKLILRQQGVID